MNPATDDARMGSRALLAIVIAIVLIIAGTLLLPTGPLHGNSMRVGADPEAASREMPPTATPTDPTAGS